MLRAPELCAGTCVIVWPPSPLSIPPTRECPTREPSGRDPWTRSRQLPTTPEGVRTFPRTRGPLSAPPLWPGTWTQDRKHPTRVVSVPTDPPNILHVGPFIPEAIGLTGISTCLFCIENVCKACS